MRTIMSTQRMPALAASPPADVKTKESLLGDDAPRRWINVCRCTDDANGEPVTRQFLELYVASFYDSPEPGPLYVGHVDADRPQGAEEPPARGWILALHLDASDRLWALVEFTAELDAAIRAGQYRYTSIYGGYSADDDGKIDDVAFFSIAVTNRPAVSHLVPIAASRPMPVKSKQAHAAGAVVRRKSKRAR